ncbi:glycosyltransferase family 2 protein [Phosphitispora fastidiosa]|uniref:glycosyltransferase family 2 protein n=1 Tax=Phosphitispora fastidiosa TaxID=2837202 RepID=UPI001E2FCC2D|nr:glycosyltransferase [Phosphitispora fastidiosa]MBU7006391.1 glycosyltransferase involved in cell wall biosynthesis [Phosphitispora fastidiosa]
MALASFVMSVYNDGRYLSEAVKSVLNQTHPDIELLIFDDASTDNCLNIIKSLSDPRIKYYHSDENKGKSYGVNFMVNNFATGEYILLMDSDDICDKQRAEEQLEFLQQNPGCVAVGSNIDVMWEDEEIKPLAEQKKAWFDQAPDEVDGLLLQGMTVPGPTITLRKTDFLKVGGLSVDYKAALDYEFVLRLTECGSVFKLPKELYRYRIHRKQMSLDKKQFQFESALRAKVEYLKRNKNLFGDRDVYVWGLGSVGRIVVGLAKEIGLEISAIIDSSASLQGEMFLDTNIVSPREVLTAGKKTGKLVLLTTTVGRDEVSDKLEDSGYARYKDFFCLV